MANKNLSFNRLVRADLRQNRISFAGVAVSVFVATMLMTGLGVLIESGLRGGLVPERYSAADVVVGGKQSLSIYGDLPVPLIERVLLPAGTEQEISKLPGVASVAADVTVPMASAERRIDAHPWSASSMSGFGIREGRAPSAADEVVLTESTAAAIGDIVPLAHGGIRAEYRVMGIAAAPVEPVRAEHAFLSEDRIAQLDPRGGAAQVLGIAAAEGTAPVALAADIAAKFPNLSVQTGDARGDVEFLDSGAARSSLVTVGAAFASTCLLVAMFIVSSTLSLSMQSRRRDFALLRAVGAEPAQVHRLVAREVFAVGLVAAIFGAAPGYLLATVLQSAFVQAGLIPGDFALAFSPLPALGATILVLVAGWSAARIAARRPARIDPVEALQEAANGPVSIGRARRITGIALGAAGLLLSAVPLAVRGQSAAGAAAGAAIILIISLALLGPVLVAFAVRWIASLFHWKSASTYLASANSAANAPRLASAITPIALGISLGLVQIGAPSILANEANLQAQAGVVAQLRVSAPGGLSNERVEDIAATPGVAVVNPVTVSQAVLQQAVAYGDQPPSSSGFVLQGIRPLATAGTMDLKVQEGSLEALTGDHRIALSSNARQALGLNVGDDVAGYFGDGAPLEATVVAIYERGLGFGDVTMSNDVVRSHTASGLNGFALVGTGDDSDATRQVLSDSGFEVSGGSGLGAAGAAERSQQGWVSVVALVVILGYIAIAVVNTLMMATGQRSREFALMQLIGASRRQVRAMMRKESLIVAVLAVMFGVAIAVPPLVGMSVGISGHPLPHLSVLPSLTVIGSMCALAVIAVAVSTRSTLRRRPMDEIGSRQ
ncbi:FtsX-like permease family protein [Paenarthrobacter nitroguajacolicus]|uniref:FtsX-like permease family protein n=1 Tax=Paenarthrobacter nitroguajacolicus TaxID=211146 RepID=A0A558H6E8_PAENT|nr:FtsX-like permease family protein [Paenarthrobacter nitroguajacolicus]TVU64693.1 FtsX-like permease family protein [Paenarthrobacter nitroguajacolicus]